MPQTSGASNIPPSKETNAGELQRNQSLEQCIPVTIIEDEDIRFEGVPLSVLLEASAEEIIRSATGQNTEMESGRVTEYETHPKIGRVYTPHLSTFAELKE